MNDVVFRALMRLASMLAASAAALLPAIAHAAPLADDTQGPGLVGPIILLVVIALLNVFVLAFAFRLRRYFRELGGPNEEE